jgi:hypothetical protein
MALLIKVAKESQKQENKGWLVGSSRRVLFINLIGEKCLKDTC